MISFLFGPNRFTVNQRLRLAETEFAAAHGAGAIERRRGDELEVGELEQLLRGASLFGQHRLVVLRDASENLNLWNALPQALAAGVLDGTHLIVVERTPDKRSKTFQFLVKSADTVLEAAPESPARLLAWIAETAKSRGADMPKNAAARLLELTGPDQERLSNELDKLFVHKKIDARLVEELVEPLSAANVFELLDAVLAGRPERIRGLVGALKTSEDPSKIVALLAGQLYSLAVVTAAGARQDLNQLAAAAGIHPYTLGRLKALVARGLNLTSLKRLVGVVDRLDESLKNSRGDDWRLLETALLKATSIRSAAAPRR